MNTPAISRRSLRNKHKDWYEAYAARLGAAEIEAVVNEYTEEQVGRDFERWLRDHGLFDFREND